LIKKYDTFSISDWQLATLFDKSNTEGLRTLEVRRTRRLRFDRGSILLRICVMAVNKEYQAVSRFTENRYSYTWIIEKFSRLPDSVNTSLSICPLAAENISWYFYLYAGGYNEQVKGKLSLSLFNANQTSVQGTCTFSLKDKNGAEYKSVTVTDYKNNRFDCLDFMDREALFGKAQFLLPDDILTIVCTLNIFIRFGSTPLEILRPPIPQSECIFLLQKLIECS